MTFPADVDVIDAVKSLRRLDLRSITKPVRITPCEPQIDAALLRQCIGPSNVAPSAIAANRRTDVKFQDPTQLARW